MKRISLFDPMLKYSEFVGGQPQISLTSEMGKKIKVMGYTPIVFYILIPILVIIFLLFVFKIMMGKNKNHTPDKVYENYNDNIPIELKMP